MGLRAAMCTCMLPRAALKTRKPESRRPNDETLHASTETEVGGCRQQMRVLAMPPCLLPLPPALSPWAGGRAGVRGQAALWQRGSVKLRTVGSIAALAAVTALGQI